MNTNNIFPRVVLVTLAMFTTLWAALPLQNEQIAVTCFSGTYSGYTTPPTPVASPNNSTNGFVVAIFDTTPAQISSLIPPPASPPALWTGPPSAGYHNELNPGQEWTRSKLGEVFGITLDDQATPDIYVAASDCYNILGSTVSHNATAPAGPGGIYKLDGTTGVASSASLPSVPGSAPGTGPGLGNLCFRRAASSIGYLYVSNLDDGLIYRVNATTLATTGTPYDHGMQGRPQESLSPTADNGAPGMTPYGRRVWGLQTWQNRLYYSVWWEDGRNVNPAESNEIWSVDLDANGDFLPLTAQRHFALPNYPDTSGGLWSYPVASIDFSPAGVMFLAERYWQLNPISGNATAAFGPHYTRVHRYSFNGTNWVTTPNLTHLVGGNATPYFYVPPYAIVGANSAGGVAVNCDESIWATGDFFNGYSPGIPSSGGYLYGALRIQPGGNPGLPYGRGGFVVDYDGLYGVSKVAIGAITTKRECCMLLTSSNIKCPITPGAPYTADVTIQNLSPNPITTVQFAPCANNQLPPGAITLQPSPSPITLGNPIAPNSSGTVSVSLPGVPPIGGTVCFLVQAVDTSGGAGIPEVTCSQKICIDLPKCPCATLTTANLTCPDCIGQDHTLDLTLTNIWNTPYYWYELVPCPPSQIPPGATSVVPSPTGIQPFSPPLGQNQSITIPVSLAGVPLTGGQVCFCVRFYDTQENVLLCEEMACATFPACTPGPGMTLTQIGTIACPTVTGGPHKLTFTITNTQAQLAYGAIFSSCAGTGGPGGPGNFFAVSPASITFAPPLANGQTSQNITVCISGLLPNELGCLCVQFLDDQQRPFCQGQLCFTIPDCPPPPCLTLSAFETQCPSGGNSYTTNVSLTNTSGQAASWFQLCPVPVGNLPMGAVTGQPTPAGLVPFGSPVPGNGGNATIPGIMLPNNLPDGANFCFLVKIYDEMEQLLCEEMLCIQLPPCQCATATADVTCVSPYPSRQVTFNVTNNTNALGSPFNFASAVVIPMSGFSPNPMTPTPNPITPGSSGTFTTIFNGTKAPPCVMLLLFNEDKTKCCRTKVCPLWVEYDPGPPKDICDLPSLVVGEGTTPTTVNAWITNLSLSQTKTYAWIVQPATAPGCTGTLPPAAFTPSSGTTAPVGPASTQGITFTINPSALTPGTCAGFQVCFMEVTPAFIEPVCCTAIIRKNASTDPCIILNPTKRAIPRLADRVIGIIKNPSSIVLSTDVLYFDTGGETAYTLPGSPPPAEANGYLAHFDLPPGEQQPLILSAIIPPGSTGTPPVVSPALVEAIWLRLCNNAQGFEILGTEILFRDGNSSSADGPTSPGPIPVWETSLAKDRAETFFSMTFPTAPGCEYLSFSSDALTDWSFEPPAQSPAIIRAADGTFTGIDGHANILLPLNGPRHFYRATSRTPEF